MKKTGGSSSAKAISAVAFDIESGEVLHVHHFNAMPGASSPDEKRIRQIVTRDAAEMRGRRSGEIGVLVVDAKKLAPGKRYRVDARQGRLIAVKGEQPGAGGSFGGSLAPGLAAKLASKR